MKKLSLLCVTLLASTAVSACAMHDDHQGQNQPMDQKDWNHHEHMEMMASNLFHEMDKNNDGVISKKEFEEFARTWFREADTDHNGKLTFEEFKAELKQEKEKIKMHDMGRTNQPVVNDNTSDTTMYNDNSAEKTDMNGTTQY